MQFVFRYVARFFIWVWWHVRIDPTGYVQRGGALFGACAVLVAGLVGVVTVLANALLGGTGLSGITIAAISPGAHSVETTATAAPARARLHEVSAVASGPVPGTFFAIYRDAAKSCDMQWEVLAAVGWVESHHGESIAPGVKTGENFAGARGPMQFLGATWDHYGVDANHDGKADVYDPIDAIHGASKYLCANGAGDPNHLRDALFVYNHSNDYVNEVLSVARGYSERTYLLPVPSSSTTPQSLGQPHHDYPAVDIQLPVGTPVTVAHGGKVTNIDEGNCGLGVVVAGYDGATYTYCHLSERATTNDTSVSTGDAVGRTGGALGEPGAGSSTGPHLHLQIDVDGHKVCPQSLLVAWKDGHMMPPSKAPTSGCTS